MASCTAPKALVVVPLTESRPTTNSQANTETITDAPKPYTGPNYLLRFPSELRDRIFELVYEDPVLIILEPMHGEEPTAIFASEETRCYGKETSLPMTRRFLNPKRQPPVNHGSKWHLPTASPSPKWTTSLTGLLLVNKQTYREAVPHLYRSCEFRLSNVAWARAFMNSVGKANLRDIRSIDFCLSDSHQYRKDVEKLRVTCARVVKHMPNIENICLRLDGAICLEKGRYRPPRRNPEYEKALLLFAQLKHLKRLVVTKDTYLQPPCFEVASGEHRYEEGGVDVREGVTTGAVRDMILTGDLGVLDERRREHERKGAIELG